jgi:hypothetical protein
MINVNTLGYARMPGGTMSQQAIHQPRVAYDAARAVVSVASADDVKLLTWFATRVCDLLGPAYRRALMETRYKLIDPARPETPMVETGVWRVRLEDFLRARPELIEDLRVLAVDAATRLTK